MRSQRSQLGYELELGCRTKDSSGTPTAPDACPTMTILTETGTQVLSKQIPIQDRYGRAGLFSYMQPLNSLFSAGRYYVTYDWLISGVAGSAIETFQVLPGGSTAGQAISMHFKGGSQANHIIRQNDDGNIRYNRNPRV